MAPATGLAATGFQAASVGPLALDVDDWGMVRAIEIRNFAGIGEISVSIHGHRLFLLRDDVMLAPDTDAIIVSPGDRTPNPLYYFRHLRGIWRRLPNR